MVMANVSPARERAHRATRLTSTALRSTVTGTPSSLARPFCSSGSGALGHGPAGADDLSGLAAVADQTLDDQRAGLRRAARAGHGRVGTDLSCIAQAAFFSAVPVFIVLCSTASIVGRS